VLQISSAEMSKVRGQTFSGSLKQILRGNSSPFDWFPLEKLLGHLMRGPSASHMATVLAASASHRIGGADAMLMLLPDWVGL